MQEVRTEMRERWEKVLDSCLSLGTNCLGSGGEVVERLLKGWVGPKYVLEDVCAGKRWKWNEDLSSSETPDLKREKGLGIRRIGTHSFSIIFYPPEDIVTGEIGKRRSVTRRSSSFVFLVKSKIFPESTRQGQPLRLLV